jgi:hypothetical protein
MSQGYRSHTLRVDVCVYVVMTLDYRDDIKSCSIVHT